MSSPPEERIIHRQLDPDGDPPVTQVTTIVADLDGVNNDELSPAYDQIDHVIDHIFSEPPVEAAQVQVTFTYEGYRITVEQDGAAQFVKVE
jgi:hypothetical protein